MLKILFFLALLMPSFMAVAQHQPQSPYAQILDQDRCLELHRPYSNQTSSFCYWRKNGGLDSEGYKKANHILRDVKYRSTTNIDPELLDVLFLIQTWLKFENRDSTIHILSGYRTREHNRRLRGSAKNSFHVQGRAVDIVIPGIDTRLLAAMSRYVGAGGVGIYIGKKFIHIDTGDVRQWRG